jgi:hypothetical protein
VHFPFKTTHQTNNIRAHYDIDFFKLVVHKMTMVQFVVSLCFILAQPPCPTVGGGVEEADTR